MINEADVHPQVIGGRYGLSIKDTTPAQIVAVFDELDKEEPKNHFTVGINDDLTFTSLPVGDEIQVTAPGTVSCKFWGLDPMVLLVQIRIPLRSLVTIQISMYRHILNMTQRNPVV